MTTSQLQHEFIVSNGLRLHYVTQGEGPLMLMLHGFPEFWYSWRHQIPEFAQHYKVVALDLPGYNESDKPTDLSAYRLSELVQDVRGVIQGLGYDRCVLVGHDWGGAIAWNFAYAHPQLVERLIVLNLPHPAKFSAGLRTPQQLLRSSYIFFFPRHRLPLLPSPKLGFWCAGQSQSHRWDGNRFPFSLRPGESSKSHRRCCLVGSESQRALAPYPTLPSDSPSGRG
ncbi:alpha/beta fold hydrolase [Leptolyngbya sp. 7M]|nr:alpha/beta fold hydrolase [Leptolyngbya sp. 7M]